MSRKTIACAMVFLLVSTASQAKEANPGMHVHFEVMASSVIVVPVMVNGHGPYNFVFDTGNESTLIDTDLAREVGLKAVDRISLESSTGSGVLARAFADEISLGRGQVRNSEVLIGPLAGLRSIDRSIRGIIGESFLRHFDYILDNAHSFIGIANQEEAPPINGVRVTFTRNRGRPLLPVKIGGSEVDFVLDSGASNVVVYSKLRGVVLSCSVPAHAAEMRGSSSATQVSTGRINRIEVAGHSFVNVEAAVMYRVPDPETDGLLPTRFFSRIYVSNSGEYVVLAGTR